MQLLCLTLKGFRGIRDGLGLDVLTLDFEALCDGVELVAIVGTNGRGKTTVLDPYLLMPSRASAAGVINITLVIAGIKLLGSSTSYAPRQVHHSQGPEAV